MYRAPFAVVLAVLLAVPALAADTKYVLTGENTRITFTGTKPGGKHDGGFKKLTGTATVTDGNPATLKIDAEIDAESLYTDNEGLTKHLKSPDFFGVKDNPKAAFKTTKVEKTAAGYTITGDLTLLGRTKPVTMPATVSAAGDTLTLTSEFKINRNDWGMSFGKGKVDDLVSLKLTVSAKK